MLELKNQSLPEELANLFTHSAVGTVLMDLDGRFTQSNPAFCSMLGYAIPELINQDIEKLTHPAHLTDLRKSLSHLISDQIPAFVIVQRMLHQSGEWVWMRNSISLIKEPDSIIMLAENITDSVSGAQKHALQFERLTQSELEFRDQIELLSRVTENATAALFMLNTRGACTFLNAAAEHITGYTLKEARGKFLNKLIHHPHPNGDSSSSFDFTLNQALLQNIKINGYEDIFVRKNGTCFPGICNAQPIIKKGQVVGAVVEIRDITQEKKAQRSLKEHARKLEHNNRELKNFAHIVAHDLKAPLRKVQIFADRLRVTQSANLDEVGLECVASMQSSLGRMQELITGLLALASVGAKTPQFETFDFSEVVNEVTVDLENEIKSTNANVEPVNPFLLYADRLEMRQLLQNLISNAIKFRRQNVAPTIKITATRDELNQVEITIEDNGIGLEERYAEQIFKAFERLHEDTAYPGTGIGLAICKKIVDRRGGNIAVKSTIGEGSTFIIQLPSLESKR